MPTTPRPRRANTSTRCRPVDGDLAGQITTGIRVLEEAAERLRDDRAARRLCLEPSRFANAGKLARARGILESGGVEVVDAERPAPTLSPARTRPSRAAAAGRARRRPPAAPRAAGWTGPASAPNPLDRGSSSMRGAFDGLTENARPVGSTPASISIADQLLPGSSNRTMTRPLGATVSVRAMSRPICSSISSVAVGSAIVPSSEMVNGSDPAAARMMPPGRWMPFVS